MFCIIKGQILNIEADKYKEDIFKVELYQKGCPNIVKIGGVPKSDIAKFQQGSEVSFLCNVSLYRSKDSDNAFLVSRYLGKA